jgi:hypothetical protein
MDVAARLSPEALVGRAVRIYWDLDDAWFLGEITGGRPESFLNPWAWLVWI